MSKESTHTRIYRETLKELKILAAQEEEKMLDMLQKLIDEYKNKKGA